MADSDSMDGKFDDSEGSCGFEVVDVVFDGFGKGVSHISQRTISG
jgi:hypothetical protein